MRRTSSCYPLAALVAINAVLLLGAGGCAGDDGGLADDTSGDPAGATATKTAARQEPARRCGPARAPKARRASYDAPPQTVDRTAKLTAVVRTSCGAFAIALDPGRFPATVNSFVFLARKGFYDGIPFDKAGSGRYLRGGDPPGPAHGPGYRVRGRVPEGIIYRRGTVAMTEPGRGGNGHAGSRFFIVLAKPWLDFSGIYPPLGVVERGFGVLDAISRLGPRSPYPSNVGVLGPAGKLRRPVTIESIEIRGRGQ